METSVYKGKLFCKINEPLIQDWFTGCFGDIETGNDGTFAYIPAENW